MEESQSQELNSVLAADFGSVTTRVLLFGLARGRFRLVGRAEAPTTALPPFGDVGEGLRHALSELTRMTGRVLLSESDQLLIPEPRAGAGTDEFVATASGGRPMRAVLVGLVPEISLESARRASATTYMTIEDTISLADPRSENEQVDAIISLTPDVVFIVGGTDDGAEDAVLNLVKRVAVALSLMGKGYRPRILFAGNEALQRQVREIFGEQTDVHLAGNVRPSLADETLDPAQTRLGVVYDDYKASSAGGFRDISQWSRVGVLPASQGFSRLVGYLAASSAEDGGGPKPALGVDVGSATTVLAAAWEGKNLVSVRSDLGLGQSAVTALEAVGAENVARWLTYAVDPQTVEDYAWNKWLRPGVIPQTGIDLEMELAFAREILRVALDGTRASWRRLPRMGTMLPAFDPILLAGAVFGKAPHPGHAALAALDALQPVGVTRLVLDPYGLTQALGAMAYVSPLAAVQVIQSSDLPPLGTVIAPLGRVKAGEAALHVRIKAGEATHDVTVHAGTMRVIPLDSGADRVAVAVKPHRRLDLGRGSGKQVNLTASGGTLLGLICDARGRPLPLPRTVEERAEVYPRWTAQAMGQQDDVLS